VKHGNCNKLFFILATFLSGFPFSCKQKPGKTFTESNIVAPNEPHLLGEGVICTGDYETHAAFSPSGDTAYFLKCMPDLSTCAICVSFKKNNSWSSPEITSFSGKYLDVDPFVTRDGNTIYFVSNRPSNLKDDLNPSWDIWKVIRNKTGWNKPVHMDTPVNSPADEYYPTLADNDNLYFGSSRQNGKGSSDIYCSKPVNGVYSSVENLGDSINTTDNEYEPFIAPDESYLLYMATKPKGLINADFYASFRNNDQWTKAIKLQTPVNSDATEWSPKVTRDGKYFYFGSTRGRNSHPPGKPQKIDDFTSRIHQPGNGLGDIYYIDFSSLPLKQYKK